MSRYPLFILIIAIFISAGCDRKTTKLGKAQLKDILRTCLNDLDLQQRMQLDNFKIQRLILNGNFEINDSLKIGNRQYQFRNVNLYSKTDSNFLYKISYPDIDVLHVGLKYQPSVSYAITGDFDFVYQDAAWKVIKRTTGIEDYSSANEL